MISVKKKLQIRKNIDLTSMVDIIFLLVIFFLSSFSLSNFSQNSALKVDLPEAKIEASDLGDSTPIVSLKKDDTIYFKEELVSLDGLKRILTESYAEAEIKNLIIAADKDIEYEKVVQIMSLSKEIGIEQISLKVDVEK